MRGVHCTSSTHLGGRHDHLGLGEAGVEGEFGELLGKVVRRDRHRARLWCRRLGGDREVIHLLFRVFLIVPYEYQTEADASPILEGQVGAGCHVVRAAEPICNSAVF
jgi:hypothetical protein